MNGTPRLRSAFPSTPQQRSQYGGSPSGQKLGQMLPDISALKPSTGTESEPLIPFDVIDAPGQRLYVAAFYVALFTWRAWDFSQLQEEETESLWYFMKWVAMDGVFLFGLPGLRIPWLEWSATTMTLLFMAHALVDAVLMFRIPIPIGAGLAAFGRLLWDREMAVNEHRVKPGQVLHNSSLILGKQIIHILPEGSAILNPARESFCIDASRTDAKLPIQINSTNPISIDLFRIDLDTELNETIHITSKEIKRMHKEASRRLDYSDKANEPRTLHYSVKKPGLYVLEKVIDESKLEVQRKRMAHTVVVPCPKAVVKPSNSDRCRGELSNVELEVTGTPPLRVRYRKVVNQSPQEASFEAIQPEDFVSPLQKQDSNALVLPNKIDVSWAKAQSVRVPLSESLSTSGRWVYSVQAVQDAFGNTVSYSDQDHDNQERHTPKSSHLHQVITVHERPTVLLVGCNSQKPVQAAAGQVVSFPLKFGSSGKGDALRGPYHLDYLFTPEAELSPTGEHSLSPQRPHVLVKDRDVKPLVKEPGLYTLTGVSTDFCSGEVMEPATCLLENPPKPDLAISDEAIYDKCQGRAVGTKLELDLLGTPPFTIHYTMTKRGDRHHGDHSETINGMRGQLSLTPVQAGHYTYEFLDITDAVYHKESLKHKNLIIEQDVKPSASARFAEPSPKLKACIDQPASFNVQLRGEGPFSVEYELFHAGKRTQHQIDIINENHVKITTDSLTNGGDYTLALASVTDSLGCKEFLKEEAKINVRHQRPKVAFGQIEGRHSLHTLEGKKVQLPLKLAGEAPWVVTYRNVKDGHDHEATAQHANDRITINEEGTYELINLNDASCPGSVDESAKRFDVSWIPRPQLRIAESNIVERNGNTFIKAEVCEGEEDAIEVLFKGSPPYDIQYEQHVKPDHGAKALKKKDIKAALNMAPLRMETSQAGLYEYKFRELKDVNYDHSAKHFSPLSLQQRVNPRPSAAFKFPGKTYSYCSVQSDGEQVIPITLHGVPPFHLDVEIKHHGTLKPELVAIPNIGTNSYDLHIPHRTLHLGRSAVSIRKVSDSRGCSRLLDATTPRVQISVHDAPTITPLESKEHYCVGDRLNFALAGAAPFTVFYNFEGRDRKASAQSSTFRRLAEKPGTFTITGLQDTASQCKATVDIVKQIHGMPSVRVSKGRESRVDIHEGGEADILFEFGGVPPFEFTYTRSTNADRGRKSVVLDMRSEVSQEHSMRIAASEEGTYEVVAIKDRYCAYAKPGVRIDHEKSQKLLQY